MPTSKHQKVSIPILLGILIALATMLITLSSWLSPAQKQRPASEAQAVTALAQAEVQIDKRVSGFSSEDWKRLVKVL